MKKTNVDNIRQPRAPQWIPRAGESDSPICRRMHSGSGKRQLLKTIGDIQ
ncbi:MAG: hypothetical protein ABL925_01580 [Methylococcales bacterium]